MSVPDITTKIGGYEFNWKQDDIKIIVNRVKSHTDGKVTGEVKITRKGTHLHQAQFNFAASRSRTELAKTLSTRDEQPTDWYSILEFMAVKTLEMERSGEPLIELYAGEDIKPPEYLLNPLIIKNYPTVLFGDPGSAKSTTAIIFSQLMTLPWKDNPLGFEVPENPIRCLYLDWETDESTIQWQLTCLNRGMKLDGVYLPYRRCALPLSQDLEQIRGYIEQVEAQIIIIDSLGLACGGELKESGPAITFFSALRQLHTTSIILAHTAKSNDNTNGNSATPKRSIYGSVYFEAQARSVWEINKDIEGSGLNITLVHRKSPPFQKRHDSLGMRYEYDDNGYLQVGLGEVKETPDGYLAELSTESKIIEILGHGPLSIKELVKKTNINENMLRVALTRMRKKDKIINVSRGTYGVPETRFNDADF